MELTKWVESQNFRHTSNRASGEICNEGKRYSIMAII